MVQSLPLIAASVALLALGARAEQPDLSQYRAAADEVLAAVREVLPDFAAATQAMVTANRTEHEDPLLAMEWTATLQLTRVAQLMPAVLEAAGEISAVGATEGAVADAAEALATAADSMQTLLLNDIPKITSAMADYLGEPGLSRKNSTGGGDAAAADAAGEPAQAVIEELKALAALVPEFFQERLACVSDVAAVLLSLVKTAEEISYTAVDCRGAEMDALACAGDVATSLRALATASEEIAAVIFDCGRVNTGCSQLLANSLSAFARTSGATLAATADCGAADAEGPAPAPGSAVVASSCTVDVLEAIYGVSTAVNSVNWLLETCEVKPKPAAQLQQVVTTLKTRLADVLPAFMTHAEEGPHRRLAPTQSNSSVQSNSSYDQTTSNSTGSAPSAPLSSAAAGGGDRELASSRGCRGVNEVCWLGQQCCSTRCSKMHRCRPF